MNQTNSDLKNQIVKEMYFSFKENILDKWYPLVADTEMGGYFSNIDTNWKVESAQDKIIVSQARHVWTLSKATELFPENKQYQTLANHGYQFLRDHLWDQENGGFFQTRSREGNYSELEGWREEKRAYGNAFGLYALSALYELTKDEHILDFAKEVFNWIEQHSFDSIHKGYFQFLTGESVPFDRNSFYKSVASDEVEVGYKDQNSSIHLLEAYTEFYHQWKNPILKQQLKSLLELIRDVMTTEKGYLNLFFSSDWKPVSFRDQSESEIKTNFRLDHISFGHDYETAFLMLEASHALEIENDFRTLSVAKKMVDHAIENGWDKENGGFYDGGYYFKNSEQCTILKDTKNWWAQAEGLNILLLMSEIFPDDEKYFRYFSALWEYIKKYILDKEKGDWFEGGIDKEPHFVNGPKSHIWKCTYHTGRALMNCLSILSDEKDSFINLKMDLKKKREQSHEFIHYWKSVAEKMDSVKV